MSERITEEDVTCRHCGKPIRAGERLVNWPWMHTTGFYQCTLAEGSTKAEPQSAAEDAVAPCSYCGHMPHLHWTCPGPDSVILPGRPDVSPTDPKAPHTS